jgi:predicted ATP-dependent endonuclease of OLD family
MALPGIEYYDLNYYTKQFVDAVQGRVNFASFNKELNDMTIYAREKIAQDAADHEGKNVPSRGHTMLAEIFLRADQSLAEHLPEKLRDKKYTKFFQYHYPQLRDALTAEAA